MNTDKRAVIPRCIVCLLFCEAKLETSHILQANKIKHCLSVSFGRSTDGAPVMIVVFSDKSTLKLIQSQL